MTPGVKPTIPGPMDNPAGATGAQPEKVSRKRCGGPCGRNLPLAAFRADRKGASGRRGTCRDCTGGKDVEAGDHGPLGSLDDRTLAANYEALRSDVLARRRRCDDPEFLGLKDEVEIRVQTTGPVEGLAVEFGWDFLSASVTRRKK